MTSGSKDARHGTRSGTARNVVLVGWAAKGVVYLALAFLVLQMAFGSAPQHATTTGALHYIARTAPGSIALIVLGIGLAYALGRIPEVTTLARPQIDGKDKALATLLALLYTALAVTAFTIVGLVGSSGSSARTGGTQEQGSAIILGLPGGEIIVGVIGAVAIAVGVLQAYKGIQKRFLGTLRTGEMSTRVRRDVHARPLGH